jgi:hypothetical protein
MAMQCVAVTNVYLGDVTGLGLLLEHFLGFFILGGTCSHFTGSFEQAFLSVKQDCQGFLTPKHLLHVDGPFLLQDALVKWTFSMDLHAHREVLSNTKRKTLQCFTLLNRPSYYKMLWSNGPSRMEGGAFKYKKENLAVLYALE